MLRAIGKEKYNELAVQAKLHGVKMKPQIEPLRATKEERSDYTKQAKDIYDSMKRRFKRGKK